MLISSLNQQGCSLIWSLLVAYFKQQKVSGAGMEREKG
jgi:hypothetical protein